MSLGRCVDCGAPYDRCEEALDAGDYTTDANGNQDGLCCEGCQHLAKQQPTLTPRSSTMSFATIKATLAKILGIGESEAHDIVTAIEQDAAPMLDAFRQQVVADLVQAFASGKVDFSALAKLLVEELAKILPAVAAEAPAEEPAAPADAPAAE